jgi:hypothetical protein
MSSQEGKTNAHEYFLQNWHRYYSLACLGGGTDNEKQAFIESFMSNIKLYERVAHFKGSERKKSCSQLYQVISLG